MSATEGLVEKDKEVDPIFRDYISSMVNAGLLVYMRRSKLRPTVKIPNTSYWWGPDLTNYNKFCWHGPEAYSGRLPPPYKGSMPNWNIIADFARAYARRLDADSWEDAKLSAYEITLDWLIEMDEAKRLCDNEQWSEASILYNRIKKDSF
jgi:hypothetical protein